ncbi:MAG: choice-of-anchor L domain-containing protein, partial [Flavobacteriales bacterium]|nr:choice-of-anchor L domain-containing protein [Flavobacteriales bacterium]
VLSPSIHRPLILLALLCASLMDARAQLVVQGGFTAQQLAEVIAGPGITVSNATINGSPQAYGTFNGAGSNIGLTTGVILTSGPIGIAVGPNNTGSAGTGLGLPGNAMLQGLAGATTYDAIVLEFDFVPLSNVAEFRYVFGSEEYPEFVNSGYNDAFGFFISGPGIAGNYNMARIPGTATPVTIDNLNAGTNNQYYVNNNGGQTVQYDAFTTVLTATANVQACQTYHIMMMIADAGDGIYDSGVFIEENSLISNVVQIEATTATADSAAYEGCSSATVTFTLENTVNQPTVINYNVSGTATNGVDYNQIQNTVTIPANQSSVSFTITPVNDGSAESIETIIIDVQTSVCGTDEIIIYISDLTPLIVLAHGDTAFCPGGTAMLWLQSFGGGGGTTHQWSNGATTDTIFVNPAATATYTVSAVDYCASGNPVSNTVTVTIDAVPVADAGPDQIYCTGDPVTLSASGGNGFEWFELPAQTLVGTAATLDLQPSGDIDFMMVAYIGACTDTDFVSVSELPADPISATGDTAVCPAGTALLDVLGATAGSTFQWTPNIGLSDDGIQNPTATPVTTTMYHLTVTSPNGCIGLDSVEVIIHPLPEPDFSAPTVCNDAATPFTDNSTIASGSITGHDWDFGDGNTSALINPSHIYADDQTYTVTLVATSGFGCVDSVSHSVSVGPNPVAGFSMTNDCQDKLIAFTDNSTIASGSITSWAWDFGNQQTSDQQIPPMQQYPAAGMYDVQLVVTSDLGCLHDTLIVLEVYPLPTASFGRDSVCLNLPNQFTDLSSANGAYAINTYQWTFSDGQTADVPDPQVTFSSPGTYSATLQVTTMVGCQNSLTLGGAGVYPLPVAQFSNNIKNCLNDTTYFEDLSTVQNVFNDVILGRLWDFSDGSSSTLIAPWHIYAAHGMQPVQLDVVTDKGCTGTVTHDVEIFPLPEVDFTSDLQEGCQPLMVQFLDQSTIPSPYTLAQWQWDFGDGDSIVMGQFPVNTFHDGNLAPMDAALYTVSLQVTSCNGCMASFTFNDYITEHPRPTAFFDAAPTVVDMNNPNIGFTDLSSINVHVWGWDFGDGSTSMEQHTEHTYPDTGNYPVILIVSTPFGCLDTAEYLVRVNPTFTFYIPNTFTPNSDFHNEHFFGKGTGISAYRMMIFDRWGEMIFESNDYDYQWDGTFNGHQVQQGVYQYLFTVVDWAGDIHHYQGHVQLIR